MKDLVLTTALVAALAAVAAAPCLAAEPKLPAAPSAEVLSQRLADYVAKTDTDKDGKVSKKEYVSAATVETEKLFALLDTDKDGALNDAELKNAQASKYNIKPAAPKKP